MRRISGSPGPYITSHVYFKSDKDSATVKVEGPLDILKQQNPADFCPAGFAFKNARTSPTGGGMGEISIECVNYGSDDDISTVPTLVTWKIQMVEVQKDLKGHPQCVADRAVIEKWLATDPDKRWSDNHEPQWVDADGNAHIISTQPAQRYIAAYNKGIENYVVHYPVITKCSTFKRLPGCSMNGNSTISGTARFSSDIDTWSAPDIQLAGYESSGWFKSGDDYTQSGNTLWTREEQWTWTPDHGGDINWIYSSAQ